MENNKNMSDYKATNADISVILTLYKRPENLKQQLEAIENQTLKPKEILLYQDGTGDTVKIPDEIKDRFNLIEISPENKGVWERFRFGMNNANCEYVCVFDDDTIPGRRWLENCMTQMTKQEGLYVTIGIVIEDAKMCPIKSDSYFRIGWDGQLDYTAEVDYGGHSWFLKREWLKELFKAPAEIQKLKIAGEDMSLSRQLAKKGIKTFVPPHPANNKDLYGSIPEVSSPLGDNKAALSYNGQNILNMNKGIQILIQDGWQLLAERNPGYVKKLKNGICKNFLNIITIKESFKHKTIKIFGIKMSFRKK